MDGDINVKILWGIFGAIIISIILLIMFLIPTTNPPWKPDVPAGLIGKVIQKSNTTYYFEIAGVDPKTRWQEIKLQLTNENHNESVVWDVTIISNNIVHFNNASTNFTIIGNDLNSNKNIDTEDTIELKLINYGQIKKGTWEIRIIYEFNYGIICDKKFEIT